MNSRETTFRELAATVEGDLSADTAGEQGQLHVPTMEERALIFLRAVKGKEDFTSDEYIETRDKILSMMASDIASRAELEVIYPQAPNFDPRSNFLGTTDFAEALPTLTAEEDPFLERRALRASLRAKLALAPPVMKEVAATVSIARVSIAMASAAPRIDMNELAAALRVGGDAPPPRQKNAKVRMFFWGVLVVILAGLSVLGGVTLIQIGFDLLRPSAY
jgi:hypothetical protein